KKTGDTMTGDLTIKKGTPSVFLRADSGVTALRFYTGDNTERGIIYAGPNTDSLGEVRIRAKGHQEGILLFVTTGGLKSVISQ
ncbi:hypothetical protein ACEV6T_22940, partial [Escherichia coli]|uniref:hypothetical protein n=1 Tax=Escherichia coli TaxID=562 RepID=UPI0035C019C7